MISKNINSGSHGMRVYFLLLNSPWKSIFLGSNRIVSYIATHGTATLNSKKKKKPKNKSIKQ